MTNLVTCTARGWLYLAISAAAEVEALLRDAEPLAKMARGFQ